MPSAKRLLDRAKAGVNGLARRAGYQVTGLYPPDLDGATLELVRAVEPFTMSTPERIVSLCDAVEYVVANDIPGDVVECGVWKGGSMMAVALKLLQLGRIDRDLYLFDTFAGMSEPTEADVTLHGTPALARWRHSDRGAVNLWDYVPADEVRAALAGTGYPPERIKLIEGRVEDTLPAAAPERIALLRLDTDWYESTRHELETLYPRLASRGVLILDDYGHWQGARRATDEYLGADADPVLLVRVDYTGRVAVKP
jgi:O-methyltransferase